MMSYPRATWNHIQCLTCIIGLTSLLALGLSVSELLMISDILPPSALEAFHQWLPNTNINNYVDTLGICGLLPLLLLWLFSFGSNNPPASSRILILAALWFAVLIFDLFMPSIITMHRLVMAISHLSGVYPSATAIQELVVWSSYLLLWALSLSLAFECKNSGHFYYHTSVYLFCISTLISYGAVLIFSLVTSEAFSPLLLPVTLSAWEWGKSFFQSLCLLLTCMSLVYLLVIQSNRSDELDGLILSHWFTLVLGFSIIYGTSPYTQIMEQNSNILGYIHSSLFFVLLAHLGYCLYAIRPLTQVNHGIAQWIIFTGGTGLALASVFICMSLLPANIEHQTPIWSTLMQHSFTPVLGLIFCFAISALLNDFNLTSDSVGIQQHKNSLVLIQWGLILFGGFVSAISAIYSVYAQFQISQQQMNGLDTPFFEVQATLQPLVKIHIIGLAAVCLGLALQIIRTCWSRMFALPFLYETETAAAATHNPRDANVAEQKFENHKVTLEEGVHHV